MSPVRVLIVDHDLETAQQLQIALQRLEMESDTCTDTQGLAASLLSQSYHLLLLSAQLPEHAGLEALRQIREEPRLRSLPVLMLVTDASIQQVKQYLDYGAADFLCKPVDSQALRARTHAALRCAHAEQQLQSYRHDFDDVMRDARAQLMEKNELLDLALHTGRIGIWKHEEGEEASWNEQLRELFGRVDPIPRIVDLLQLVPTEEQSLLRERLQRLEQHGSSGYFRHRLLRPDGSTVLVRGCFRRFQLGERTVWIGVMQDASGEKQEERQNIHKERVYALGELSAGITHELKNPLNVIQLWLENLRDELNDPQEVQRGLKTIETQVQTCLRIINSLGAFSRQAQDTSSRSEMLPYREVLEGAVILPRYECRRHRIALVEEFPPSIPLVQGNAVQIQQVLVNLLSNALQATRAAPERYITLRVYAQDGWCWTEVQDTGTGIPPEQIPHIFDAFYTTKPLGEGTGLGLSICRQIISEHGGVLTVESLPDVGTTFRFSLPLANSTSPSQ